MIHPTNRFERLLSAQKKEHARQAKADKARGRYAAVDVSSADSGRMRARLARETLTIKELEDAVSSGEDR